MIYDDDSYEIVNELCYNDYKEYKTLEYKPSDSFYKQLKNQPQLKLITKQLKNYWNNVYYQLETYYIITQKYIGQLSIMI